MSLAGYIKVVRRRWWLIAIIVALSVAGAAVINVVSTRRYTASTELIVNGSSSFSAIAELNNRELAMQRAVTFAQLLGTSPATRDAMARASADGVTFGPADHPHVVVTANGTSPFIEISVTDTGARQAQAVANALIGVLPEVAQTLDTGESVSPGQVAVLSPAALPRTPSSPQAGIDLKVGVALGLVLAGIAAFAAESLDRRIRDGENIGDPSGLPTLAVVPYEGDDEPLPAWTSPLSARAESYRRVRSGLMLASEQGMPRSISITSAAPGDGKSSLAANLAILCKAAGLSTVLVDADVRRPVLHAMFGLRPAPGLSELLSGEVSLDDALQSIDGPELDVMTAGLSREDPTELIASNDMRDLVATLEDRYDLVIFDGPPLLPVADAVALAVRVSAVLVVGRIGVTTEESLDKVFRSLKAAHANVVGVVSNGARNVKDSGYRYSGDAGSEAGRSAQAKTR
jgi:succinoglycan biosynthesis transport protein ExoP